MAADVREEELDFPHCDASDDADDDAEKDWDAGGLNADDVNDNDGDDTNGGAAKSPIPDSSAPRTRNSFTALSMASLRPEPSGFGTDSLNLRQTSPISFSSFLSWLWVRLWELRSLRASSRNEVKNS